VKGHLHHYAVSWLAIGALALTVVLAVPPFSEVAELRASTAGVLLAGAIDAVVFAFLARTAVHRPDRFEATWLKTLLGKFIALGAAWGGVALAAPHATTPFCHGLAIAFLFHVIHSALALAPLFAKRSSGEASR
jgi:hypothetical protein